MAYARYVGGKLGGMWLACRWWPECEVFGSRLLHSGLRICNDLSDLPSPVAPLPAAYCISYIPRSLSHQEFIIIPKYSMGYEIFTHKAPDDEMKHACPQTLAEIILLQEPKGMGLLGSQLSFQSSGPPGHILCVLVWWGEAHLLRAPSVGITSLTLPRRTRMPPLGRDGLRGWQGN